MQELLLLLKDNVNAIFSGLVVVLVGGLMFFVVRRVMKYRNRAWLKIYYDAAETYHKAQDRGFGDMMGNFGHVMVKNKSKSVAKNCIGELLAIKELKGNQCVRVPGFRNIAQLK